MKQESIGFSLIKLLVGLAILVLLVMLYWSSSLIENDVKAMKGDLVALKEETEGLRLDTERLKKSLLDEIDAMGVTRDTQTEGAPPLAQSDRSMRNREHIDPSLPNLLEEDAFYKKTLPAMLGANFRPSGVRQEGRLGRPENLHPFNPFRDVSKMWHLCNANVSKLQFGKYETMAPNLALKLEARKRPGSPTAVDYWVHLRDDIYWKPLKRSFFPSDFDLSPHFLKKHPVTAHDFKFFFDVIMNPHVSEAKAASLRSYFSDIAAFEVIDDQTFVVKWKTEDVFVESLGKSVPMVKYTAKGLTGGLSPLPSFVYKYFADGTKIVEEDSAPNTYQTNSVFAQNFSEHFAKNVIPSCGPFVFDGMNDERICFKRNADFMEPLAVLVKGLNYRFKESFDGVWQDFKSGKSDLCVLAPSQLPELKNFLKSAVYKEQAASGKKIHELDFVDQGFYYIGWNQTNPLFANKKVRRALTQAIDRDRIIEQNINNMGVAITGPFSPFSPAYDASIDAWPFNPDEAKRLLDAEGWVDLDGDGIRDKLIDGKRIPFRFTLVYFAKNVSTKVICEYIATALKEVGIDCRLSGLDIADLSRSFDDKSFDAIYLGWSLGTPPEDPKQIWHSSLAKEKGSSNAIGFAHPKVDEVIEKLHYEYDKTKRQKLYHAFHKIIHDEAPYTFLYSPKSKLLYRDYVHNVFIPRDRQDLVPGADISEPDFSVIWLSPH